MARTKRRGNVARKSRVQRNHKNSLKNKKNTSVKRSNNNKSRSRNRNRRTRHRRVRIGGSGLGFQTPVPVSKSVNSHWSNEFDGLKVYAAMCKNDDEKVKIVQLTDKSKKKTLVRNLI